VLKDNSKAMSETCVYHVDLVSSMKTDEKLLAFYKDAIGKLDFDGETIDSISESCEINHNGFLEIYIESENTKITNFRDLVSLVKNLDSIVGGFADNSEFSLTAEFPYSRKSWKKNGFDWELIYDESDDYYDDVDGYDEWDEESDW